MSIKADHEFLFVGKGEDGFLENYVYEEKESKDGRGGKVFMSLEILNNPVEGQRIGTAIFNVLKEVFYKHFANDAYVRFEEALKDINSLIKKYKSEKESKSIGILNVSIGAIQDNKLYLSNSGESEVYLIRGRFVSIISEGLASPEKGEDYDLFENIASGTLEPSDYVVFSTSRLLRYVTKVDLGKAFTKKSLELCLEEVKDLVSAELVSKIALIGVHITKIDLRKEPQEEMIHVNKEEYIAPPEKSQVLRGPAKGNKAIAEFLGKTLQNLKGLKRRASIKRPTIGKDKLLYIVVALAVVIVVGAVLLKMKNSTAEYIAMQEETINAALADISDAESKSHFDKKQAAAFLDQAEQKAVEVLNSGEIKSKATQTLERIQELRDEMDNVHRISEPKVLADLSLKRSDIDAKGIIPSDGRLYVYEYNALYEVIMDRVEDPVSLVSDDEEIVVGDYFEDRENLIFLTDKDKIIEYTDGLKDYMDTDDGAWNAGIDIGVYSNKVYILDKEADQIWKYTRKRDNYSGGVEYISGETDMSKAVSFAIDGGVYVLNNNGYIDYYYSGEKQDFVIMKPPIESMEDPTKIFTAVDLNQIYILEPGKNRVIVLTKDSRIEGVNYTSQYVIENTDTLQDVYVDYNGMMYLLDSSKIYEIDLSVY